MVTSILTLDPEVIILDESTTGQNPDHENPTAIMECMKQLKSSGKTLLMLARDRERA